jgi:hypothetical protein
LGETVGKPHQPSAGWRLVWADEFDKEGRPDPGNWGYETGFVRNMEFQWYQPENARCEKGLLIIEGRRERKNNPNFDPNSKEWKFNREHAGYTSGSLITKLTTANYFLWRADGNDDSTRYSRRCGNVDPACREYFL